MEEEKTWVVISAGESMIVEEKRGEILEKKELSSRVDRKHTQGGYSQKRFERKREEQIEEHLEQLREELDAENPYVVGEQTLASKIDGKYIGGFDSNRPLVDALYGFQILER